MKSKAGKVRKAGDRALTADGLAGAAELFPRPRRGIKIGTFIRPTILDKNGQAKVDYALLKFLFVCGIPFQVLASRIFQEFLWTLLPAYQLPDRSRLVGIHLATQAAKLQLTPKQRLKARFDLTMFSDGWTKRCTSDESYTLDLNHPNDMVDVLEAEVLTGLSATAAELSFRFIAVRDVARCAFCGFAADPDDVIQKLEDMGPEKVSAFVSDSAANITKARRSVQEKSPGSRASQTLRTN